MGAASIKKLAVLFPGRNYSTDSPLFYYAVRVLEEKGYDILKVNYGDLPSESAEDAMSAVKEQALGAVKEAVGRCYSEYLFLSKSIGTIVAGYVEELLAIPVRHVFLTPLPGTLRYMKPGRCLVIAGGRDYVLKKDRLKDYCTSNQIALWQADNGGHSLNVKGNPVESVRILGDVVRLLEEFV